MGIREGFYLPILAHYIRYIHMILGEKSEDLEQWRSGYVYDVFTRNLAATVEFVPGLKEAYAQSPAKPRDFGSITESLPQTIIRVAGPDIGMWS